MFLAECHFDHLAEQAKALSELRVHSSSKRAGQKKPKILEENVPKTDTFQPFVKDEALVSIYNVWDITSFQSSYLSGHMTYPIKKKKNYLKINSFCNVILLIFKSIELFLRISFHARLSNFLIYCWLMILTIQTSIVQPERILMLL